MNMNFHFVSEHTIVSHRYVPLSFIHHHIQHSSF